LSLRPFPRQHGQKKREKQQNIPAGPAKKMMSLIEEGFFDIFTTVAPPP
jgi:hypothetical protein